MHTGSCCCCFLEALPEMQTHMSLELKPKEATDCNYWRADANWRFSWLRGTVTSSLDVVFLNALISCSLLKDNMILYSVFVRTVVDYVLLLVEGYCNNRGERRPKVILTMVRNSKATVARSKRKAVACDWFILWCWDSSDVLWCIRSVSWPGNVYGTKTIKIYNLRSLIENVYTSLFWKLEV